MVELPSGKPQRRIVTGWREVGKTAFCRRAAELACAAGWDVAGLLSLSRFEGDRKTGIEVLDLRSGERRVLADLQPHAGVQLGRWSFRPAALEWGNQALAGAAPCDLLVVDEMGPLEFDQGLGWTSAFQVLEGRGYRVALAVVRPEYCPAFQRRWEGSRTLSILCPAQALRLAERWGRETFRTLA